MAAQNAVATKVIIVMQWAWQQHFCSPRQLETLIKFLVLYVVKDYRWVDLLALIIDLESANQRTIVDFTN